MKTTTSLSEYLIDYMRREIITGGLTPGEKIEEYQLAESLNVRRPILREVLGALESEGLVRYRNPGPQDRVRVQWLRHLNDPLIDRGFRL